jgi:hypothetical protein
MPIGAIPLAKEIDRVPSFTVPLDHAQEQREKRSGCPAACGGGE